MVTVFKCKEDGNSVRVVVLEESSSKNDYGKQDNGDSNAVMIDQKLVLLYVHICPNCQTCPYLTQAPGRFTATINCVDGCFCFVCLFVAEKVGAGDRGARLV
jgi:hypothetical protein